MNEELETRVCQNCQKDFSCLKIKTKKFCSKSCARIFVNRKKALQPPSKNQICVICGKEFKSRFETAKYCSKECRVQQAKLTYYRKENIDLSERECVVCQIKFIPLRQKQVCCSDKCYSKMFYYKAPLFEKVCAWCKKPFGARKKETIYCSSSCSNSACKQHPPVEKICEQCGKTFIVKYSKRNKRFCNQSCATTYGNNHLTEETFKKMSETKKRMFASGELIHPWVGKHHSEETKQKISELRIKNGTSAGENNPMFGRKGELSPIFGCKRSDETKNLMAEAKAEQWMGGKYNGVNFKSLYKTGHYESKKAGNVFYRSGFEKKAYQLLDKDAAVLTYMVEPVRIAYEYDHTRQYIPDLFVFYSDGMKKMIEIKPHYLLESAKNLAKFTAAREYCAKHNMIFEIWTENNHPELLLD